MSTVQRKVAVSPTLRVRFSGVCRIVGRPHTFTAIHTRLGLFWLGKVHFMTASHSWACESDHDKKKMTNSLFLKQKCSTITSRNFPYHWEYNNKNQWGCLWNFQWTNPVPNLKALKSDSPFLMLCSSPLSANNHKLLNWSAASAATLGRVAAAPTPNIEGEVTKQKHKQKKYKNVYSHFTIISMILVKMLLKFILKYWYPHQTS